MSFYNVLNTIDNESHGGHIGVTSLVIIYLSRQHFPFASITSNITISSYTSAAPHQRLIVTTSTPHQRHINTTSSPHQHHINTNVATIGFIYAQ